MQPTVSQHTHPTDASCIFCKILAGAIPCHKFYEDDTVLAFLDIGPVVSGHALVIPRAHHKNVFDIPAETFARVSRRLPDLARAVTTAAGAPACHILLNNGAQAMQSVFHLHYHIIPRRDGDRFFVPWNPEKLDAAVAARLIDKIQAALTPS